MAQETLLGKKYCRSLLVMVAAGGMLLGLLAAVFPLTSTKANSMAGPMVIDRDSVVFGKTYSEWSAAWWQWNDSIPAANHPLLDNGDCSVGQSGPVWFLGGKFCNPLLTCSYTGVVRNCNVPYGKALFFPILDYEDSALEESVYEHPGDESYQQIATLRSVVYSGNNLANVYCSIDGAPVHNLRDRFRVQSTVFVFTLPADNLPNIVYNSIAFTAGAYFPAVDDGWYVMLDDLPRGSHTVHFGGTEAGFSLDVTYHLNVGP